MDGEYQSCILLFSKLWTLNYLISLRDRKALYLAKIIVYNECFNTNISIILFL